MHKALNAMLVLAVLVAGFFLYSLEHATRGLERDVASLTREIDDGREMIKLLNAEWSSLTRPERVQKLAAEHLNLQATAASQFVKPEELSLKVPETPPVKLEEEGKDPIGDILTKMQ